MEKRTDQKFKEIIYYLEKQNSALIIIDINYIFSFLQNNLFEF